MIADKEYLRDSTVKRRLWNAADMLINQRYPHEWTSWLVYILGVLQGEGDPIAYTDFLEQLQASIARRLDTGKW